MFSRRGDKERADEEICLADDTQRGERTKATFKATKKSEIDASIKEKNTSIRKARHGVYLPGTCLPYGPYGYKKDYSPIHIRLQSLIVVSYL